MEDGISSYSSPSQGRGSTALMLTFKSHGCDPAQRGSSYTDTYVRSPPNDMIQSSVYNQIRVALRGDVIGGGLGPTLDSSVVVHLLRVEDTRLFRWDIFSEAAQWGATSDERALEFIISLHDLWSRAVVHWSSRARPWWISVGSEGDDDDSIKNEQEDSRRRLQKDEQDAGRWMGVLTSTDVQLLTHIVPWEGMGIIQLDQQ